ncbi:ribosomal protein L13 [Thermobaculum terrenum ATCC BAA-798]|mgnify:FL=1|uniref:Large ribosomal subunit protein uL13 n=1 Tax=Thermobaculum terrenum (strain ATCC BAA-798 / CCMEE 7001 / YNP1) TaxID=525904 RepID=D1CFF6_THET1|nr:50S ribosomal protein L13 [Thermobaculum terrenum]ACZ41662.1 ribosomal protein L13 [Thermobaculum terrenum ATCC BAA-798]
MKTYTPKANDYTRDWWLIDATGQNLGRLASEIARLLMGKHKPVYTPFLDTGDFVIVVNADKISVTGKKLQQKVYYRHSGYPGGIKATTLEAMLAKHPTRALELAVKGMLPKNRRGRDLFRKLKVYAGPEHPHAAQQPKEYKITNLK